MVQFNLLAGGFTTFIATYVFDTDAGTLTLTQQSETAGNPSWIVQSPINPNVIFATNENSPVGGLESFAIQPDISLFSIANITSSGNAPTFASVLSTGEVTACNFGSPNITIARIDPNDSARFVQEENEAAQSVVSFPREEGASNPHMSLEVNGELLIPDLGADRIWRLSKGEGEERFALTGEIPFEAGNGPRHIAMQEDILLTLHEKTSVLTAQRIPEGPNGTTAGLLANVTIVPENPPAGTKFAAAEIVVSESTQDFPDRFIYVSNRNIGETIDEAGDTIAIFQLKNGAAAPPAEAPVEGEVAPAVEEAAAPVARRSHARQFLRRQEAPVVEEPVVEEGVTLELIAQVPTGLQQIRSFSIGPAAAGRDSYLIAGANTAGGVSVFRRIDGGRNLELVVNDQTLGNRTSFLWV